MNAKGIPQAYKLAIICIVLFINAGFVAAINWNDCPSYYDFSTSGNTVLDLAKRVNGTMTGTPTPIQVTDDCKIGYCINFSGHPSGRIEFTSLNNSLKVSKEASFNVWVKINYGENKAYFMKHLDNIASGDSYYVLGGATQYENVFRTAEVSWTETTLPDKYTWHMLTVVVNVTGNYYRVYMNKTNVFNSTASSISLSSTSAIGGSALRTLGSFAKIDEMSFWNKSLSQAEINELYNDGAGLNYTYSGSIGNLTLDSVSISPSPNALDIDDLKGYAMATDLRGYTINYTWAWYNGTKIYTNGSRINAPPNVSVNLANISAAITTTKSNWTFSAKATSHNATTGWINSSLTFVREFMIANCSTYNYTIWNISYFDEYSLLPITAMNTYDLIFSYPFQQQLSGTGSGKEYDAFCSSEDISGVYNITAYGSFKLDKTGYTTRIYNKDLASAYNIIPPKQNLSLFMISIGNTSTVLFNTYDNYDKSQLIAGVQEDMYQIILGVPVYMESRISDITGKAEFSYIANKQYRFIFQKSGYKNYTFDLNPIQQISYDVFMNPVAGTNVSGNFDRVAINIMPQIFYTGANRLNFTIASFYGELTSYSYTLTYPGGTTTNSGSNSNGETLNSNINIINPALFDEVQIDIFYTLPVFGTKSMTYFYPIGNMTNNTLMNPPNQDATYGMGLIERLLIVIFGAILIAGLCYLGGMEIPGMLLQFTWSGIWCYLNFVPFWAFLPSIFIAMIIISSRST